MNPNHLAAHVGAGVTMRLDLFEKFSEGFDPEAKAAVLENLRLGFPLGVEEPPPPWAPSFLSDKSRTRITSYFEAEVSDRRMLGPFTTPPLPVNIGARQSPSRSRQGQHAQRVASGGPRHHLRGSPHPTPTSVLTSRRHKPTPPTMR